MFSTEKKNYSEPTRCVSTVMMEQESGRPSGRSTAEEQVDNGKTSRSTEG